jgi:glyoxylase-like metal-dependent hydrolase (beta-lactamase superfamily II)
MEKRQHYSAEILCFCGRPDLAQKAAHLTQEELAGMLYDSLYQKILPLNDDIVVYPAHGAGSACGKNMQKETVHWEIRKEPIMP